VREATDLTEAQRALADDEELAKVIRAAREAAESMTALRIEGTLREFATFKPRNVYFRHPIHIPDETGTLADIDPEVQGKQRRLNNLKNRRTPQEVTADKADEFDTMFSACDDGSGSVKTKDLAAALEVTDRTVRNRAKKQPEKYTITNIDGTSYVKLLTEKPEEKK
jgi:hypothetical protein